jgi:hypothetical protein
MAITYEWKIDQCEHVVATGFITTAHWRCNAVDSELSASVYGSAGFSTEEGQDPEIPYADVTEQDVLDWIWANGVDKEATEENLANQIDALKNPVSESGTPWAS